MIKPKVKDSRKKILLSLLNSVFQKLSYTTFLHLKTPGIFHTLACLNEGVSKTPPKMAVRSFLVFISEQFLFLCIAGYQMIFLLGFEFQLYVIIPYIKSGMHFYSKHQLSSVFHVCFDKTNGITFSYFSAWLLGLHDLHRYLSAKLKKLLCLLLGICIAVSCTDL